MHCSYQVTTVRHGQDLVSLKNKPRVFCEPTTVEARGQVTLRKLRFWEGGRGSGDKSSIARSWFESSPGMSFV